MNNVPVKAEGNGNSVMGNEYIKYVILLSHSGLPMSEDIIREHVKYLKNLDRDGKLILCGPFKNYNGGMVIINAASIDEAEQIAKNDPFVKSRIETYEIREWELSCEENNHLGMG
jgi:uncharacterized protein YciI